MSPTWIVGGACFGSHAHATEACTEVLPHGLGDPRAVLTCQTDLARSVEVAKVGTRSVIAGASESKEGAGPPDCLILYALGLLGKRHRRVEYLRTLGVCQVISLLA